MASVGSKRGREDDAAPASHADGAGSLVHGLIEVAPVSGALAPLAHETVRLSVTDVVLHVGTFSCGPGTLHVTTE